ncbi:MAG: hypothetical protein IPK53_12640 [bacterium]|nr:hypothetical protein [bacterium]
MRVVTRWTYFALLLCTCALWADVPKRISYQGVLTDEQGLPVHDGTHDMSFAIYAEATGGTALWSVNRPVTTVNGVFEILLGENGALTLPFDRDYWLETASTAGTFSPRARLVSSPYSLRSGDVDDSVAVRSLNGLQDHIVLDAGPGLSWVHAGDTLRLTAQLPRLATDLSGATTELTAEWQSYEGLSAAVQCSGTGIVICESSIWLQVSHTQGTADRIQLCHAETQNSGGPNVGYYSLHSVPAEFPTYVNNDATHYVKTVFEIAAAGEHTFYLNARATQGVGGDRLWYGNVTATFYPAHMLDGIPTLDGALEGTEKPSR